MDFTYSCNHSPGGTMHLSPSHNHIHNQQMNSLPSVSDLRRSLSRSPSRLQPHYPASQTPQSPQHKLFSPSPTLLRTPKVMHQSNTPAGEPPLLFPIQPTTAKKRPMFGRNKAGTPLRMMSHTPARAPPPTKTPIRRALSDASDNGNASIANVMGYRGNGQENSSSPESPTGNFGAQNGDPAGTPFVKMDHSLSPFNFSLTPSRDNIARPPLFNRHSPATRGDKHTNLSRSSLGSPSGKRKIITGGFDSSSPFDITSNSDRMMLDTTRDQAEEDEAASNDFVGSPPAIRHHSNLRRSLRLADSRPHMRSRYSVDDTGKVPRVYAPKTRSRQSLDSGLPQMKMSSFRDSGNPDDTFGPTPVFKGSASTLSPVAPSPPKHDDNLFQKPALPPLAFSKSLPIGAARPKQRSIRGIPHDLLRQDGEIATPEAYRMAKPDPVAFMSTGLVSKKHRNPDDMPAPPAHHGMPDTPCKKNPLAYSFQPSPVSSGPQNRHFPQPSFGTPSRPFSIHSNKGTPFARSGNIFGSNFTPHNSELQRRASFASITSMDGEEVSHSPLTLTQADSQSSADELPPTPTKNDTRIKPNSLRSKLLGRADKDKDKRSIMRTDTFLPPSAAEQQAMQTSFFTAVGSGSGTSPKTPCEGTFPFSMPDPSNLSISPRPRNVPSTPFLMPGSHLSHHTPATPTHRDSEVNAVQMSLTPSNHVFGHDVDSELQARFNKSEWYGRGEFSEVYKVSELVERHATHGYFSLSLGSKSSQTPSPEKLYIVKKSRQQFMSAKVMQKKLREVRAMQKIGNSEHIVQLINHWEANHHLYIQLEFCEEGSLEDFLFKTGRQGRLDDFRIWKILIELTDGLKHIHDAGYIHLDLKPANVFIDFGGVLKIGDFGMAARLPIKDDVEGEGDRRYIGPDLLQGRFDKPADIFALGMIMFEIASNVIPPDNGASWQKLRSGEWSGLPSLTSSSTGASGSQEDLLSPPADETHQSHESLYNPINLGVPSMSVENTDENAQAPSFMVDAEDEDSLDNLVHWMMSPNPDHRPAIDQILITGGINWVRQRRRSGATIFEGPWGPSNMVLTPFEGNMDNDHEMTDA